MYSFPFEQDFPLLPYLSEHSHLSGRGWLVQRIERELLSSNSSDQRGLVIVAEMGYGKSAVVSSLLCPASNEIMKQIQSHITAFHVCKFSVKSTKYPERFIQRLVGFLAMKSPEYGSVIEQLSDHSILFNRESCSKEPDACFDQGITIPLKQLREVPDKPWIVVIDALDECEVDGKIPLLELIADQMPTLPKWLKFLVTSRNITSLKELRKFTILHLLSDDPNNMADIKSHITSVVGSEKVKTVETLVRKSEGSFMYVLHALDLIIGSEQFQGDQLPNLPSGLADIYELNFDRIFRRRHSYLIPKTILEIICSTRNPLNQKNLYNILQANKLVESYSDFEENFRLVLFCLRINEDVSLSHQSVYHWLINNDNSNYRISLKRGHALISNFLFTALNRSSSKGLVDLAIHVANSEDRSLSDLFLSQKLTEEEMSEPLLHRLVWRSSSTEALKLLLYYFPDVNTLSKGNITPAFIAASKGHIEQLELLHQRGASLDFTVKTDYIIISNNIEEVFQRIELMKTLYYSGYSLLHIAAQHGHIEIVKYLLRHNKTLLDHKNAVGLHAGLTACENGHLDVIIEIYKSDPTLFDIKCMYHAAKRNFKKVVEWLVEHGVSHTCISEKLAEEAYSSIVFNVTVNKHGQTVFQNKSETVPFGYLINPVDKWWELLRQDPLITAIKEGSMETAEYLIQRFPDALRCTDTLGYTAALSSVLYNRTEIFELLKEQVMHDRCVPDNMYALASVQKLFEHLLCPEGASAVHVAAMYYSDGFLLYAYKYSLNLPWNEADSNGNLPIHYAVINKNILYIMLFKRLGFSYGDAKTRNGSTVFHTAMLTQNPISLHLLTDGFKTQVPDLTDEENRTILHYLAMRELSGLVSEQDNLVSYKVLYVFRFLLGDCKQDITAVDSSGKNILHYLLNSGNCLVILELIKITLN